MRQFQVLKAGDPKFAIVSGFERIFFYFLSVRILFLPGRNLFPRAPGPAPGPGGASVRPFGRSAVRPFVRSGRDGARNLRQFHVLKAGGSKFATVSRFEGRRPKLCDSFSF